MYFMLMWRSITGWRCGPKQELWDLSVPEWPFAVWDKDLPALSRGQLHLRLYLLALKYNSEIFVSMSALDFN